MSDTIQSLDEFTSPCSTCDLNRYVVRPKVDLARAERCEACFAVCPACHGEEYAFVTDERGYRFAKPCPVCGALGARIQAFNEAGVPARYHHREATLQAFQRYADPPKNSRPLGNLPKVHMKLYSWARGFRPGEKGFLMWGDVGTGKTHLLAAVIRHLTLEKGINARFVEFTHLLSDIREGFDRGHGESAVLGPVVDIPVLAIDELGKGRRNEWQLSIIDEIISKRYNRGLTTLFTTNYPVVEQKVAGDVSGQEFRRRATLESLLERVDERIFSRLHEMADFIQIDAPDYRRR